MHTDSDTDSTDSETPEDFDIIEQVRRVPPAVLDARTERRIRAAVLGRISEGASALDWLLRPLWRPVLALLLPFATGLAFGQSDYLVDAPLIAEPEQPVELVTSIDAAHSLLEYYDLERIEDVD